MLKTCRNCSHSRREHIFDVDAWECVKCQCHFFQEVDEPRMVAQTAVTLSLNERNILIQSLKRNVANIDTATFLELLEKLK